MLLHALSTSTTAAGATTALLLQAPTSQVGHSLQLRSTHLRTLRLPTKAQAMMSLPASGKILLRVLCRRSQSSLAPGCSTSTQWWITFELVCCPATSGARLGCRTPRLRGSLFLHLDIWWGSPSSLAFLPMPWLIVMEHTSGRVMAA
ncbi:hypothetical protein PF001_g31359 [Phytophthora fragariae]|uniref:Uncharacterized protein n=2 Tax=Phytophthora fragariae TaxID=53985 RepID=A0A6A4AUX8_9STRA|nr:hypothetical protein PF001_g31359 [Phytophthora fragariae]